MIRAKLKVQVGSPYTSKSNAIYEPGQWLSIQGPVNYPGKFGFPGSLGWLAGNRVHDEWALWTLNDIDASIILSPEQIEVVEISSKDQWIHCAPWGNAPFKVEVVEERQVQK